MQQEIEIQPLFHDGHQQVGGHGDSYLALDSVLRSAEEALDAQMLLDPLEEEFHLPVALLVERSDGLGGNAEMVGEKHQRLAVVRILVADAPQVLGVAALRVEYSELDRRVAHEALSSISRRLSRQVSWAKAMHRNWSAEAAHVAVAQLLATSRRKVCHGATSITWARTSAARVHQLLPDKVQKGDQLAVGLLREVAISLCRRLAGHDRFSREHVSYQ